MDTYIKILVIDDEKDSRDTFQMLLESQGYQVRTAASAMEAEAMIEEEIYHVILTDIMMPEKDGIALLKDLKKKSSDIGEVIMVTGYGSVETAVEAMKQGAFGYFIKSHDPEELLLEIQKAAEKWNTKNMRILADSSRPEALFTSKNPQMCEVWKMAETVADSKANILITGESGTGKEIIAQWIHYHSNRREKPFIAVNCSQYPRELIESELFGHEKGAFTGALNRHVGKLEQAAGGTVFLDEIGDMAMEIQVKLLRTLENREIERLGGNKPLSVEPQTMKFLLNNKYVGNVRELKNIIERMAILSGPEGILSLEKCYPEEKNKAADRENETNLSYRDAKQQFEREYLSRSLEEHDGNITRTAEAIGMSRRQLFNKISELGIDKSIEKHN